MNYLHQSFHYCPNSLYKLYHYCILYNQVLKYYKAHKRRFWVHTLYSYKLYMYLNLCMLSKQGDIWNKHDYQ